MAAPHPVTSRCRICDAEGEHPAYEVREMMFGFRDPFLYFQCTRCGCLQIADVPAELARYYPPDYYAHQVVRAPRAGWRRRARNLRNRYAFFGEGPIGWALARISPYAVEGTRNWFRRWNPPRDARILDVGCGSGDLLYDLSELGFSNLLGIDPYLAADVQVRPGLSLLRRSIHEVEGSFDLITLHHSLEHSPDQIGTLEAVARVLHAEGECLVRIPTVSSLAWEEYREDWVQLDAPRHLFLHSTESMRIAVARAGLEVAHLEFDSTELQFTGSDLYRRDIPLTESTGVVPKRQIRENAERARELNRLGRGDSVAYYLRHARGHAPGGAVPGLSSP